jgi:hypothetical protein
MTMNDEEKKALLASINHWEQNVARKKKGLSVKAGSEHCPCCRLQRKRQDVQDVKRGFECFSETGNCPIAAYTGTESCDLTPYYYAHDKSKPKAEADWLRQLYRYLTGESKLAPILWEVED